MDMSLNLNLEQQVDAAQECLQRIDDALDIIKEYVRENKVIDKKTAMFLDAMIRALHNEDDYEIWCKEHNWLPSTY